MEGLHRLCHLKVGGHTVEIKEPFLLRRVLLGRTDCQNNILHKCNDLANLNLRLHS